jgi:hypothetical protein
MGVGGAGRAAGAVGGSGGGGVARPVALLLRLSNGSLISCGTRFSQTLIILEALVDETMSCTSLVGMSWGLPPSSVAQPLSPTSEERHASASRSNNVPAYHNFIKLT